MRVLVSVIPGLGHLHPMVPLCRALVAAGHDVRVAVPPSFVSVVERSELVAVPAGPDWLESEADAFYPGFTSGVEAQTRAFVEIPRRGLIDDLVRLGRSADVVLHDHTEFGGWVAAELLGIPNVPFAMTTRLLDPAMLGLLTGDGVHALLAAAGLPPDPELTRPSRWLYLDSIPPSFAGVVFPPGPTVRSVQYGTDDRSGSESLPSWIADLGGRPLVYVTLGTVFNRTPGLLRKLVEGAASLDVDVIATTGRNADAAALGPLPSNVWVESYIPQVELLDRCDAVVCHAGFNTVFGSLSVGRPLVLVPLSADQPLNAFLCDQGGFGKSCTTDTPEGSVFPLARPEAITSTQVAGALATVLKDPSFAHAAGRVQDEIAKQPPVSRGVELIEQLVTA